MARRQAEALRRRRLTGQHLRPIQGAHLRPREGTAVEEVVDGQVVAVRPDSELRIVRELVAEGEGVPRVRAGRIAGRRHGDTLEVRRRADRELLDDPAVGETVVDDRRVAVVVVLTAAAEAAPERVGRNRPVDGRSRLVEDREVVVDDLEVVVRPDRAVRVRRRVQDGERALRAAEPLPDPLEARSRHGCSQVTDPRLHDGVGARSLWRRRQQVLGLGLLLRVRALGRRNGAERRRHVVLELLLRLLLRRLVVARRFARVPRGALGCLLAGRARAADRHHREQRRTPCGRA